MTESAFDHQWLVLLGPENGRGNALERPMPPVVFVHVSALEMNERVK